MRADWLLMKDVRDDLAKLRARMFERTGSNEIYEVLLGDLWHEVIHSIEDERAVNGGTKRYGLRTPPVFRPEADWAREIAARNYVGRPRWDILVDRILRAKLEEWSAPSSHIEKRVALFRAKEKALVEFVRREEKRESTESPPSSDSPS